MDNDQTCASKECSCNKEQEILTEETIGYTWYVGWLNGGGAGSWTPYLQKSMVDCHKEMMKHRGMDVKEIRIVQRKYKDRMNFE